MEEETGMDMLRRFSTAFGLTRPTRLAATVVAVLVLSGVPLANAAFSVSDSLPQFSIATNTLQAPADFAISQTCTPPPPVVFRGATSNTGQDALVLTVPFAVQSGDVLVAQVSNRNGAYGGVTTPSGWTLLGRTTSGTTVTEAVYWKRAAAAEPAYYVFDLLGSSGVQMSGGIAAYSGVDQTAPVNAFGTATGASSTASAPSVTTTVANVAVVHTFTKRQEALPAPAGTTQRWRLISGNGTATQGSTASDVWFVGPGSTQVRSTSTGFNTEWVAHTIALRPVPGTPSVDASWTPTASAWATGYRLERAANGWVEATQTITPRGATSAMDGPLANGVGYTYRLTAYKQSWTSPVVAATLLTNC
jgi:hypothetical protein